jgi:hypothetical protein
VFDVRVVPLSALRSTHHDTEMIQDIGNNHVENQYVERLRLDTCEGSSVIGLSKQCCHQVNVLQ